MAQRDTTSQPQSQPQPPETSHQPDAGELFLGSRSPGNPLFYEAKNLTTHGVIVGMTGSGKTGLGTVLLEEALLNGTATLIIDPKGDMGNLKLQFAPSDAQSLKDWVGPDQDPQKVADLWNKGLSATGTSMQRRHAMKQVPVTVYTPGSTAGVPLNMLGALSRPDGELDGEVVADELSSLTTSLLNLVGINSDPLSGREHIFLSALIADHWRNGREASLESLIQAAIAPPFRKLGVLPLDALYPESDRMALAMKLNGLVASPSFKAWSQGVAIDIQNMLFSAEGAPKAAVVNIHHLDPEERQSAVTLLLSRLLSWIRRQQGSSKLRVLVYMDEVFGYVPPTKNPPAKTPILTILKQARAFGVGMVLSTQNPVDLDYKALSNAGTWMIGRLQTERDKARLIDGLRSADGTTDIGELSNQISNLNKRQFVLQSTKTGVSLFDTRWAMSYLAGPLSREQLGKLAAAEPTTQLNTATAAKHGQVASSQDTSTVNATSSVRSQEPTTQLGDDASLGSLNSSDTAITSADDEVPIAPKIATGVMQRYLRNDASWASEIGHDPASSRLEAHLAIRIDLLFDDAKADIHHQSEWEAIVAIDGHTIDIDDAIEVDFDDRDFDEQPPQGVVYAMTDAQISKTPVFTAAKKAFKERIYRNETITVFANRELKLYGRIGEDQASFTKRCTAMADDLADDDIAKLRDSLLRKQDQITDQLQRLEDRVREAQYAHDSARDNQFTGVALDVLGGLLGGRKRNTGRSIMSSRRRTGQAAQRLETAQNRYKDKLADLHELQAEVDDDINQVLYEWHEKAAQVEHYEIRLSRSDITIDDVILLWVRKPHP